MHNLYSFLYIFFNIISVVILTDMLGAIGHWFMDSYGNPKTPIVGKYIFQPNIEHHKQPEALIAHGWFESISTSVIPVLILDAMIWCVYELNWQIILGSLILANVNIIHKWNHCSREQKPILINWLHDLKILQTPENHALHHQGKQNHHYAAITNVTNPILEYLNVWRILESIVYKLTKIEPMSDVRVEFIPTNSAMQK